MKKSFVFLLLCCMLCVPAFAYKENSISGVACGDGTVFILMDDGKLISWGDSSSGMIPCADSHSKIKHDNRILVTTDAKAVEIGTSCAFLIDNSNTLYGWGSDGEAALLCGRVYGSKAAEPIRLMDNIQCVSCGNEHNAAIALDGKLYIWGRDTNGSLGLELGSGSIVRQPQAVLENVSSVCCLGNDTVAVSDGDTLYAWGEDFGYSAPHKVTTGIVDVKRGCDSTFILKNENGEVLLMQCIVSEDGTPAVHMTAPLASNISEITDYGYIRDDGTLWMCQSPDSNTFVPSAKNVRFVDCHDMRYRVYLSLHTLHIENYEFSDFVTDSTYPITEIDLPIIPSSGGIFGAIFLSLVIAVIAFIIIEKPQFYLKAKDTVTVFISDQLEKAEQKQDQ